MKKKHDKKKAWGIVLLIIGLVFLFAGIFVATCYYIPSLKTKANDILSHVNYINIQREHFTLTLDFWMIFPLPVIAILLFIPSHKLRKSATNKAIIKSHNLFGQPNTCKYYNVLRIPFLVVGGIAIIVGLFIFNGKFVTTIPFLAGLFVLYLGIVMLFPISLRTLVKRQFKNNQLVITFPASTFYKGKFYPEPLINELSWAVLIGYSVLEKYDNLKDGRTKLFLSPSSKYKKSDIKILKKNFNNLAISALESGDYIEPVFMCEKKEIRGKDSTLAMSTYISVPVSDIIAYYSDENNKPAHRYTPKEENQDLAVNFRAVYFYYIHPKNNKKYYLIDRTNHMYAVYELQGDTVSRTVSDGYGHYY